MDTNTLVWMKDKPEASNKVLGEERRLCWFKERPGSEANTKKLFDAFLQWFASRKKKPATTGSGSTACDHYVVQDTPGPSVRKDTIEGFAESFAWMMRSGGQ